MLLFFYISTCLVLENDYCGSLIGLFNIEYENNVSKLCLKLRYAGLLGFLVLVRTVTKGAQELLENIGLNSLILDRDDVRTNIHKHLGFTPIEIEENYIGLLRSNTYENSKKTDLTLNTVKETVGEPIERLTYFIINHCKNNRL